MNTTTKAHYKTKVENNCKVSIVNIQTTKEDITGSTTSRDTRSLYALRFKQ